MGVRKLLEYRHLKKKKKRITSESPRPPPCLQGCASTGGSLGCLLFGHKGLAMRAPVFQRKPKANKGTRAPPGARAKPRFWRGADACSLSPPRPRPSCQQGSNWGGSAGTTGTTPAPLAHRQGRVYPGSAHFAQACTELSWHQQSFARASPVHARHVPLAWTDRWTDRAALG